LGADRDHGRQVVYPGTTSVPKTHRETGEEKRGMKLRTERKREEVIIERNGESATFYGSPLTPKEITKFLQSSIKITWERNQRFESPDIYKFKVKKMQRIIDDWKGVEDLDGLEMKCTPENIELLYLFNSELIDEVLDEFDKLGTDYERNEEHLEKN